MYLYVAFCSGKAIFVKLFKTLVSTHPLLRKARVYFFMDIYIYALKSGKTILYVGRTRNPLSRFKSHITLVRGANKSNNLYRDLFNRIALFKTLPEMIILKVCDKENANFWEAFYCKKYSKKFELYNSHFVCSVGGNYKPVIEIEKRLQIKNFLKNKHLQQDHKRIYFNKKKIAIKNI